MAHIDVTKFLDSIAHQRPRTLVIVDFGNVSKWNENLGWKVGVQELGHLVKRFSSGAKPLRRFYYGEDRGPSEDPQSITPWSKSILQRAKTNDFEVVSKVVKYIRDSKEPTGLKAKCDLDVEMAIDMVRLHELYDHVVIFSGDGDLVYALKYLHQHYGKTACVFGARGHLGKEVTTAMQEGFIKHVLFADDFESRLDMNRHKGY